ncbi:AfsA-related hotdog domain-containing protein [Corynebacterium freiburgense]|uniref:AfsA-related hotdog domain-containing protein n=1 Tax=Corynebacterium freiburgense TaxID=556548 RepID=UPI0004197E94|nr:AfsA-related hotdog domain-containing protein [Corynebacterium freiburgense]WJZ02947.1 A-factor biosynthesis hotdog domain protein [Corynebacterium freiburgense]
MQNSTSVVTVVGDRFEGLARQGGVQTVSQILKVVENYPETLPECIVIGQGIGEFDLVALNVAISKNILASKPRVISSDMVLASRSASHKHRAQNVLVANLRTPEKFTAIADLRIDNDNELLLDHQTGQHVQGIIAIEAARQMFLASTTCLQLIDSLQNPYFVIESMNTQYLSFLFPLPATLRFVTNEPDSSRSGSIGFAAIVEIEQNGATVSRTEVTYTVFSSDRIFEIENRKAVKALYEFSNKKVMEATLV